MPDYSQTAEWWVFSVVTCAAASKRASSRSLSSVNNRGALCDTEKISTLQAEHRR
jgi:hypothetical protein